MKKIFFIVLFLNLISINKNINSSCPDPRGAEVLKDRYPDGSCNHQYDCATGRDCFFGKCDDCS